MFLSLEAIQKSYPSKTKLVLSAVNNSLNNFKLQKLSRITSKCHRNQKPEAKMSQDELDNKVNGWFNSMQTTKMKIHLCHN